jgi:hypothetical protein
MIKKMLLLVCSKKNSLEKNCYNNFVAEIEFKLKIATVAIIFKKKQSFLCLLEYIILIFFLQNYFRFISFALYFFLHE